MSFFAEAVVALLAGLSAIQGDLSTAEAAALIGVVKLLSGELKNWVNILLNIIEGYSSLVEICEVFNEDVNECGELSSSDVKRASTAPNFSFNALFERMDSGHSTNSADSLPYGATKSTKPRDLDAEIKLAAIKKSQTAPSKLVAAQTAPSGW